MCCSISPVNVYLFLSLIDLLRRYAYACTRLTIVKLRVLCEQNSLRTEQRHSNLSQTLEHVEALTRSLKAMKDTKDEKTTVERLLMEAELCKMLDEKREKLMKRDEEVAMEEERHREGVKAVLELKKKLKKILTSPLSFRLTRKAPTSCLLRPRQISLLNPMWMD